MKAYFPKNTPVPSLMIMSTDETIKLSISADDSGGRLTQFSRFNVWFFDSNTDECEGGLNIPRIIYWLSRILLVDQGF